MPRHAAVDDYDDIPLDDAIAHFYKTLVLGGGLAANTARGYKAALERLRAWCAQNIEHDTWLGSITDKHISRYVISIREEYQPNSLNIVLGKLRVFFGFCRDEGWIQVNPMRYVRRAKEPQKPKAFLNAEELLGGLDAAPTPFDRFGWALGMGTALRGGDIATVQVGNVDLVADMVTAWTEKGDKTVYIPIIAELRTEIITWFQFYAASMGVDDWTQLPNDWYALPSRVVSWANPHDHAAGKVYILRPTRRYSKPQVVVHRVLDELGLQVTGQRGFHILRRSAAEVMRQNAEAEGKPAIRIVQRLLGHARQSTTEGYLNQSVEQQELERMMRGRAVFRQAAQRRVSDGDEAGGVWRPRSA